MEFKLVTHLDKIKLNGDNKERILEDIKDEISNLVSSNFNIFIDGNYTEEDIYGFTIELKGYICCGEDSSFLGLETKLKASGGKNVFEAIYNIYKYLETLTSSKEGWSIDFLYHVHHKIDNEKFRVIVNEEKLRWDFTNYGDVDILEILHYTAIERSNSSFTIEDYNLFEKELRNKEKYRDILQEEDGEEM